MSYHDDNKLSVWDDHINQICQIVQIGDGHSADCPIVLTGRNVACDCPSLYQLIRQRLYDILETAYQAGRGDGLKDAADNPTF